MASRDSRSPLARLSEDLDGPALQQLNQHLVTRVRGPFDPDIESRCALAILRAQEGKLAQARSLLEEARLIDPLSLMSYNLRIQLESQAGPPGEGDRWMRRHARIEGALARGRPLNDDDVAQVKSRIERLTGEGRSVDVCDVLEDFLFGDLAHPGLPAPVVGRLYHELAELQARLGRAEATWRCRHTAVLMAPDDAEAVRALIDAWPDPDNEERVGEPHPAAWELPEDPEGAAAAEALHTAGVSLARRRAVVQRIARMPVRGLSVIDLGEALPPAYTRTLGARSWVAQAPDAPILADGPFEQGPLDLSEVPENAFDRAFLHGPAALRPGTALEAVARCLVNGGRALAILGPASSSAWGHGHGDTDPLKPLPHWAHLVWSDTERETFARVAQIDPATLVPTPSGPTALEMLTALVNPGFKVSSLQVVRRAFPLPHVRHRLRLRHPELENVHDWGYEVVLEKA